MASQTKTKGFSLAELLIGLLIVSILMAASMPIITQRKTTGSSSYWMSLNNSDIYYGIGNTKVGIGTSTPTSKLSVEGDTNVAGNVMTTGNITASKIQAANYVTYDGSVGASGSFIDKDGHTVTVKNGLITSISP